MGTESQKRVTTGTARTSYWVVDVQDQTFTNPNGTTYLVPGSGHFQTDVVNQAYTLSSKSRSSLTTPGFNSPNRPSPLVANGFSFSMTERSSSAWWERTNAKAVSGVNSIIKTSFMSENYSLAYPMPSIDLSALQNKLTNEVNRALLLKAKDMTFNSAQAMAERKQTSDLVAKTATRVAKAMAAVKRGDIVGAGKALGVVPSKRSATRARSVKDYADNVGNAWLELNYGWQPLLNDVYGSAEALAKSQNNRLIGKVKSSKTFKTSRHNRIDSRDPSATGFDEYTTYLDAKITVKAGLTFGKSSPPVAQLSSLGITNPALIAWELMPYSFVVDWFVPIGSWLSSLDATLGLEFYGGFFTVFQSQDAYVAKAQSFTYGSYTQVGYGREAVKTVTVTRYRLLEFPSVSLPAFKNPVSSSHVASAMALLLQTFKR